MLELDVFPTVEAATSQLTELRRFVEDAFDGDFSGDDWAHALGGTHVVVRERDVVLAHASVVARTLDVGTTAVRTGYVEAVGTVVTRRREGIGSMVMAEVARIIEGEYELGALSTGSHTFYERLGWERWRGPTFAREGDRLVHTPDDDDSVMVLRFGPRAGVDLTSRLVCESRPGDPW